MARNLISGISNWQGVLLPLHFLIIQAHDA
jgi:hypothetical protein